MSDRPPIAIIGAGGIGGYLGAMLSLAGEKVVLVDGWPDHVEAVRKGGLRIEAPDGEHTGHPGILHLGEAQVLRGKQPRIVILSVKLHDTDWAATLARHFLSPGVPLVTVQNALVEEDIARLVGWSRVVGGIATGMNVELAGPGLIRRGSTRFRDDPVFKIGEINGRITPRVEELVDLFAKIDTTVATTTLWNDRWQKLCINAMVSGLGGLADMTLDQVHSNPDTQAIGVKLGAEGCAVGMALGMNPCSVFGLSPETWIAAGKADAEAAAQATAAFAAQAAKVVPNYRSGTMQDLSKGRRTEVDFFNGLIAERGREVGVAAPTHAAVARMIRDIEAGRRAPARSNLKEILT